ncbi:hypothetical protein GCM10027084_24890 [Pseudoxanthomonas sangjuensis]|uniref:hypothetical protein n=1 Tax=Pseudoxanthomonas sangjuensis TaxID=1503750 RepID=UPI001391F81E|nr:hypothetical protein [Pseudoxanthomonas sangjuensis]KAF1711052.1 hypothetical protein CSC71_10160 [Pseudoxanthomonas sangjuensis]
MNTNESGDDLLRWQLRGLRRDLEPGRDLWPDIAARIATAPQAAKARRARPAWLPMALAASLLLAFGAFWRFGPAPSAPSVPATAASSGNHVIQIEAAALSRQYQGALVELVQSGTPTARAEDESGIAAAIHDLDRSAAQIRAALERSPDSRFLLERLRRTYARRLALTQRAILA